MARYLVFAGMHYYPEGGWLDLKLETDDIEMAKSVARKEKGESGFGWAHIIDIESRNIVYKIED